MKKSIFMLVIGALVGSLVTSLYLKKQFEEYLAEEKAEIFDKLEEGLEQDRLEFLENKRIQKSDWLKANPGLKSDPIQRDKEEKEIYLGPHSQLEKVLVLKDRYKKIIKNYNTEAQYMNLEQVGVDMSKVPDHTTVEIIPVMTYPYLITAAQYNDDEEDVSAPGVNNEKILCYYYMEDAVLTDDEDNVIEDIGSSIGDDSLLCFDVDGYDVFYVRNNGVKIDYQVIRQDKSYSETVLGDV